MEPWRPTLDEALDLFQQERFAEALEKFLSIRDQLAPPGVDAQIFLCMKQLKRYDQIIPYLKATLEIPANGQNAELWRMLGLLLLHNERNVPKAMRAWKYAMHLDPSLAQKYDGFQFVHLYDVMKETGGEPVIDFVDLETGHFGIHFST
jgi:tetratricopeptide (TPR) repeat protein